MTLQTKATAKTNFETGDRPSQTDFENLIDSTIFQPVSGGALNTGFIEVVSTASATAWPSAGAMFVTVEASGATARSLSEHVGPPRFHVANFGAPTDATDALAEFNNAISAAKDANGGIIECDPGVTYGLSDTLTVDGANILLKGAGSNRSHDVEPLVSGASTIFRWLGASAGTMVYFTSPAASANSQRLHGGGMVGIALDCNGVAGRGLFIETRAGGLYDDVYVQNPADVGIDLNCLADGALIDPSDVQNNRISNINVRCVETPATAAICLRLTGVSGANASFNYLENIALRHTDGVALQFGNSDNNVLQSTRIFREPSGTGIGVEFQGGPGPGAIGVARGNHLIHLSPGGGLVVSRGTASATAPAVHNNIRYYDKGNTSGLPTIESGSSLHWSTDEGMYLDTAMVQGFVGDSIAAVSAARGLGIGTRSMVITNLSSDHLRLMDNSDNKWNVNVEGASGNLRFVMVSGDGAVRFENTVPQFTQTTVAATSTGISIPSSAAGFVIAKISAQTIAIPFFRVS